ncbi:MAG: SUMF1/EgtB/PvdO family nonheme iron enzyme, partial [Planctomycetaceae bacterium]|nr:SUMF1/EgtB/PvdO family nonheme iron enzyme [Planctomycetaceae bacterium]
DEPPHPQKFNPEAHPDLCALALEMMSKAIEDRPSSMQTVVERLTAWETKPSPEELEEQRKKSERRQKLESGKRKVADLIKRGQYAQAVRLLEKMGSITDADSAGYASWARDELKRVKDLPKKVREGIPSLVATAKKLIGKHDYGQAAEMLQQIPLEIPTTEVLELTKEAIEKQEDVDLLLADLHDCVNRRQYHGIEDNLKCLLELKPHNHFALEVWEALQTYNKIPPKRRRYRFDENGKLQPYVSGLSGSITGLLLALLAVGGIAFAITLLFKSGDETLSVEVDDALLAKGDITLKFDGKEHIITGPEFQLTVRPGEYGYEVRQGNSIIRNPQQFTVVKDGQNVLQIGVIPSSPSPSPAIPKKKPVPIIARNEVKVAVAHTTPLQENANDPFAGRQLKDRWSKNFLGTTFLWIPPGQFRMGSVREIPDEHDEQPVDVEFTHGLWVQQMELTQGEWRKLVGLTPWAPFTDKQTNDRNAATHMTWDEAVDYCQRLTDRDRRLGNIPHHWEYRLPTEAEWEYFCRAGTKTVYSFGDDIRDLNKHAWWKENTQDKGEGYAHEVGKLLPNPWGLHDVHGNVFEFCYDSYRERLPGGRDPVVADPPIAGKIARGGGWAYVGGDALECSDRAIFARNVRRNRVGMRLVLAPVSEISAKGYGRQMMRSVSPAGSQKVIDANSWHVVPKQSAGSWSFANGTLTAIGSRGMSIAYFNGTYDEFELTMEIRCADSSNGGVYLRAPQPHATFQNVFEVHFGGGRDSVLGGTDHPSSGGIYLSDEHQPPKEPGGDRDWTHSFDCGAETNAFRSGEWNRVKFRLVDQLLEVDVNNQTVFWRLLDDLTLAFPHFTDAVAERKGHIGLQAFFGTVEYRNIRIQPLRVD